MNHVVYPEATERLNAHKDTIPLPLAKLVRRLGQLPQDRAYRITLWFEDDNPKWVIEEMGKAEG